MDKAHVLSSALWAAYGDALGFLTELTDERSVEKRIHASRATITVPWRRTVGGRFGAVVDLPAGTYSDDTQLRLATCRAIRGDGVFDVEAFAKVELPVWLAYALGAGRGTKAAASAFRRSDVNWYSNFFTDRGSSYLKSGGNGAAMRIQPHVWAARDRGNPASYLTDVIRNAICTHGHARGILGAVFHAWSLGRALDLQAVPEPADWIQGVEYFRELPNLIRKDSELQAFWLPTWEKKSGETIDTAFAQVQEECLEDLRKIEKCLSSNSERAYHEIVLAVDATTDAARGSGTKTAIIATTLAWMYQERELHEALVTAANVLSSDTDTIATMTGAILGAVVQAMPQGPVLDRAYIEGQAIRLGLLSASEEVSSFKYPDLLGWEPPRTQADVVGHYGNGIAIAGLGVARPTSEKYVARNKTDKSVWQWLHLEIGQSVLCKQRARLSTLPQANLPKSAVPTGSKVAPRGEPETGNLFDKQSELRMEASKGTREESQRKTLDDLTKEAINSGFDPRTIGEHFLSLADHEDGIERALAYAAIITKAKLARRSIRAIPRAMPPVKQK